MPGAAHARVLLDNRVRDARPLELKRGGESAEAGADHDDLKRLDALGRGRRPVMPATELGECEFFEVVLDLRVAQIEPQGELKARWQPIVHASGGGAAVPLILE